MSESVKGWEIGGYLLVVAGAAKVGKLVLIVLVGASVPVGGCVSYLGPLFVYLVCCFGVRGNVGHLLVVAGAAVGDGAAGGERSSGSHCECLFV